MNHLGAGASVEKIGEAAACAVKRLHLDHRMVQVRCIMHRHVCGEISGPTEVWISRPKKMRRCTSAQCVRTGRKHMVGLDERRVAFSCEVFSPLCRPRRASA